MKVKKRVNVLWLIALVLLMPSCRTNRVKEYKAHLNSYAMGQKEVAQLRKQHVDTIMAYFQGCSSCAEGAPKPYHIFWKEKEQWKLTKFDVYGTYNTMRTSLNTAYLREHEQAMKEPLMPAKTLWSHYSYETMMVYTKADSFHYTVRSEESSINASHPQVIWIDKVRSRLLSYVGFWRSKHHKREKIDLESLE